MLKWIKATVSAYREIGVDCLLTNSTDSPESQLMISLNSFHAFFYKYLIVNVFWETEAKKIILKMQKIIKEKEEAVIAVEAETILKTRASLKSQKSKRNNFNLYKMRKVFLILGALIWFGISANAQDIILKKDGSEIKAKVLEITEQQVKYKDFDFQNGPIRNININWV